MIIDVPLGPFRSGTAEASVRLVADYTRDHANYRVERVIEQPNDGRRKSIVHHADTGAQNYRHLTHVEKLAMQAQYFRDLLGDALYMQALEGAWLAAKPAELVEHEAKKEG